MNRIIFSSRDRQIKLLLLFVLFSLKLSTLYPATLAGRQNPFGDIIQGVTPREVGMGGTRIAVTNDSSALFSNPARLTTIKKFDFTLVPSLYSTYEKASHSDAEKSFDENSLDYFDLPLIAAGYSFRRLTLAVGWATFFDFRYFYNTSTFFQGKVTRTKRAEDFGGIQVLAGAASYRFRNVSLGISLLSYHGTPSFTFQDLTFNPQTGMIISSTIRESKKVFGGEQILTGISYQRSENLNLSLFFKGHFIMSEIEKKTEQGIETQIARKWIMPYDLGLGFSYTFSQKESKPTFAFDLIRTGWERTEISEDGKPYQDANLMGTISYHLGMEHLLKQNIPFRYGFSLVPFYGQQEADSFTLSIGSGYTFNLGSQKLLLELSGEYQIRSMPKIARLFPESKEPDLPFINQDSVSSYIKRLIAAISYKF